MNQNYTRFFTHGVLAVLLLLAAAWLPANQLVAQSPSIEAGVGSNVQWKDYAFMQQVIQQEVVATNLALAQPNLTDWTTALMQAYKSFLNYTQLNMQPTSDMGAVLDQSYDWIKAEPVQDVPARKMVLDDMKAKQVELIVKLTFN